MYYLCCLFDHRCNPPKPHYGVSYHIPTKEVQFYQLYQPGSKLSLYDIKKNEEKLKEILLNESVVLSDFHSFVSGFKLNLDRNYDIYDVNLPKEPLPVDITTVKKCLLIQISKLLKVKQLRWQQILANSQLVYQYLENTGYYHNGKKCHPVYDIAYTGRSKCLINNIQGASASDSIHHINDEFDMFIHFDWIAADFRIVSLISDDEYLKESFIESDPYTVLYEELNSEDITRDQCKIELFKSLYSMNSNSALLEFYPDFMKWMIDSAEKIQSEDNSFSILKRKFILEKGRTTKSVFNAQIQGSVAHAMQSVLYRVFKLFPDNILTEVHDSLILCCNRNQKNLKEIIAEVSNIMLFPFDNVLDTNPKFPVKVSIGFDWKEWKIYKEYR